MSGGIEESMAAERADYAVFLDSLGIADHAPFQLPVLTAFQIADPLLTDHDDGPAEPDAPASAGRIAFSSYRDGNEDIYVVNADGTDEIRLTSDPSVDSSPDWSPDGRHIAFDSNRDGDYEVYVMNADGSGLTQLTHNRTIDGGPKWSPDGNYILFGTRYRFNIADCRNESGWLRPDQAD